MKKSIQRILVLFSLCGILLVHSVIGVTVGRYANSFDAGSFNLSIKKNTYTVTYYDYKATANEEEIILKIDTVEIGTTYTVNYTYNGDIPDGNTFKCWTNAGGTQFNNGDTIPVTNTSDVVLRPSFNKLFTITFVQQDGTIIKTQTFTNTTDKSSITTPTPDAINQMEFDQWVVRNDDGTSTSWNDYDLNTATGNITVYPVYVYAGNLGMTPIDSDGDGAVDYYRVDAVDSLDNNVVIPGNVNGIPVSVVSDLTSSNWANNVSSIEVQEGVTRIESGAFADTPELKTISLPSTLEYLGSSAFVDDGLIGGIGGLIGYKKPAITYNGTKAEWDTLIANSASDWDNNLGTGTTIICTDGTYTLTNTWRQMTWNWTPKT